MKVLRSDIVKQVLAAVFTASVLLLLTMYITTSWKQPEIKPVTLISDTVPVQTPQPDIRIAPPRHSSQYKPVRDPFEPYPSQAVSRRPVNKDVAMQQCLAMIRARKLDKTSPVRHPNPCNRVGISVDGVTHDGG